MGWKHGEKDGEVEYFKHKELGDAVVNIAWRLHALYVGKRHPGAPEVPDMFLKEAFCILYNKGQCPGLPDHHDADTQLAISLVLDVGSSREQKQMFVAGKTRSIIPLPAPKAHKYNLLSHAHRRKW